MRILSDQFMEALTSGELSPFLQAVKHDDTLSLEIRNDYINIYYRGGSIFKISHHGDKYGIHFDMNYCRKQVAPSKNIGVLQTLTTLNEWAENIPFLKSEMDAWFFKHPKSEREYQQIILRENIRSKIAGDTDYFISDIEYANAETGSRFDLLGVKWVSTTPSRKNKSSPTLAVMELKYGDSAIEGDAGIVKHFSDIRKFFSDAGKVNLLIRDAENMFNQKTDLGLIPHIHTHIHINQTAKPEFLLLIANHKPVKTVLLRELKQAVSAFQDVFQFVDIRVPRANCLGYGLYEANLMDIRDYIKELEKVQ